MQQKHVHTATDIFHEAHYLRQQSSIFQVRGMPELRALTLVIKALLKEEGLNEVGPQFISRADK